MSPSMLFNVVIPTAVGFWPGRGGDRLRRSGIGRAVMLGGNVLGALGTIEGIRDIVSPPKPPSSLPEVKSAAPVAPLVTHVQVPGLSESAVAKGILSTQGGVPVPASAPPIVGPANYGSIASKKRSSVPSMIAGSRSVRKQASMVTLYPVARASANAINMLVPTATTVSAIGGAGLVGYGVYDSYQREKARMVEDQIRKGQLENLMLERQLLERQMPRAAGGEEDVANTALLPSKVVGVAPSDVAMVAAPSRPAASDSAVPPLGSNVKQAAYASAFARHPVHTGSRFNPRIVDTMFDDIPEPDSRGVSGNANSSGRGPRPAWGSGVAPMLSEALATLQAPIEMRYDRPAMRFNLPV